MRTTQIGRRWARELKVTAVLLAAERRKDGGGGDDVEGCSTYARPMQLRRRSEKSNECFHAS